jgi:NitT/TauT family transport system ATP-binding protein
MGTARDGSSAQMLEIDGLRHVYGGGADAHEAIADVVLSVAEGEIVSLVGPSGCGKTTLLRCVSGLTPPTAGRIALLGRTVTDVPRGLAIVFQDYSRSLFPWMSVRRNVEFPLRGNQVTKSERRERAHESLEAVALAGFADRYPWQLSGGMQQRVALARALAYRPSLLLMDEPFASVDAQTRADLEDLLLGIRARFGITVLFVTHDIDESIYIGDRVVVLSAAPARVVTELKIDLPEPRDQIATKELDRFVHLRAEIARCVRDAAAQLHRGLDGLDTTHPAAAAF